MEVAKGVFKIKRCLLLGGFKAHMLMFIFKILNVHNYEHYRL